MDEKKPVVYILHGEDEFEIANALARLEGRLGDPVNAALNTTRLEGGAFQPEKLLEVAGALPFLAERRLVILVNPTGRLENEEAQQKFLRDLDKIPPTTALILCEDRMIITHPSGKKRDKRAWLSDWADAHSDRALITAFPLPKGAKWRQRIQELAGKEGGQLSQAASEALYELTDGDPRLAAQEVRKLLAYVNYGRTVQFEDVQALTADVGQGDIFKMVDALGLQDRTRALGMLRRLLENLDYYAIFGMVVRQFRLLAQTRDILDGGGGAREVVRELKLPEFLAERMIAQARRFSIAELGRIYRRLLETDEAAKSSQMPGDLALETLVMTLTNR